MRVSEILPAGGMALFGILTGLIPLEGAQEKIAEKPPIEISGVYPSLAMFNHEGECGIGAVVPWADRLWVITYGPHLPFGSTDKLYEITPDLKQVIRPESVGGTPASRMIHDESKQLLIGPYVINEQGGVRAISPVKMPGRITAVARHLFDPEHKVYYATMEDGLYEVDLGTLNVKCLLRDRNLLKKVPEGVEAYADVPDSQLPGYHGKGLYTGQDRVVFANNGERRKEAEVDSHIPSGALAEWHGKGDYTLIRRNQFTEITGPGGIHGSSHPGTDPIWTIGWDTRSLIFMVLDKGVWHSYRLPKASNCYDGAHGWHTEWPRIRDIGEKDLLMTMHGMFWTFPRTMDAGHSGGIRPRSTYLRVIADFCRWGERLVFGGDETAVSEFNDKRGANGQLASPGQSQSNLWFTEPDRIDHLGPVVGRGALWLDDMVKAGVWSEPYQLAGYAKRSLLLAHDGSSPAVFELEIDRKGTGDWRPWRSIEVPVKGQIWTELGPDVIGEWIRIRPESDCARATAFFQYAGDDSRRDANGKIFKGMASIGSKESIGGFLRTRGGDLKTLAVLSTKMLGTGSQMGETYELDADLKLKKVLSPGIRKELEGVLDIPDPVSSDEASAVFIDDQGHRWRLPKGNPSYGVMAANRVVRIAREISTERDLFNCDGTFYELPAPNAGDVPKIRPIATHDLKIQDFCSYRGMLVMTGVDDGKGNPHIVHSEDGKAAVWLGVIDDLWQLGKPRGLGGPWKHSRVKFDSPSDPYLMTGFDRKRLNLANEGKDPVTFRMEVEVSGEGKWLPYKEFGLKSGESISYKFPDSFQAYWVRFTSSRDTTASAQLTYD